MSADKEPSVGPADPEISADQFAGNEDNTPLISPLKPSTVAAAAASADGKSFTVEQAMNHIGYGPFQWRTMVFTGSMWGTEAMEMMLLSFLVPELKDAWNLNGFEQGLISSSVFLGSLVGTFMFAVIADHLGRRIVLIWTTFGCALFGTLTAAAPGLYVMLVLRFVLGACIGAGETASVLAAELSPTQQRGSLLIAMATFWSTGALLSAFLAWISLTMLNWRWYLVLNAIPLWFVWLGSFMLPESPRFLSAQNRMDESMSVLQRIADENDSNLPDGLLVASQRDDTQSEQDEDTLWDMFRWDAFGWTSPLLFIMFNVVVGIYYGISFVSEHFFAHAHGLGLYLQMVITTSAELPGLLIGFLYLDIVGRKQMMLICFILFTVCTCLATIPTARNQPLFGLACMFIARLCVNLGFTVIYVYYNEYYPTTIRSTALGSSSALARLAAVGTSFIATSCPLNTGLVAYGAISALGAFCCYLLPFDTYGITMVDTIDEAKSRNEFEIRKARYETAQSED